MTHIARRARVLKVIFPLAAFALAGGVAGCKKKEAEAAVVETVAVSRQDIVVDVEATGVLSPINAVEVRSKASGQIVSMPVQTGTEVKPGDLLVHIDPRDARTRFDQANAQLKAARTSLEVTRSQYERAKTLSQQGVITAPELESATTAYANAQSQVANAQASVETARVALEDVTIRAPSAGVVIARNVAPGQVIASATNSASGGTVLLTLADLNAVYDSTLVSESDIGKVKPGQQVSVTVDAYPNRVFRGVVEKIEPRATVQQSVTMFPVLVRLDNSERLLMPGMNSDVTVLVQREPQALTVSNDALATPRDAGTAATALGLDPEQVRALISGGNRGNGAPVGDTGLSRTVATSGGTVSTPARGGANGSTGANAAPGARGARGDSSRGGRMAGGNGQWRGGQGGGMGGGMSGRAGAARAQRGVVFVKKGDTYEPRLVTLGIGNYDVTQILSGLEEGEQVALISSAVLQQTRTERNERMKSRSQLPGMGGGTSTGTARPAGGAGGAGGGAGGPGGGGNRGPGGGGGGR